MAGDCNYKGIEVMCRSEPSMDTRIAWTPVVAAQDIVVPARGTQAIPRGTRNMSVRSPRSWHVGCSPVGWAMIYFHKLTKSACMCRRWRIRIVERAVAEAGQNEVLGLGTCSRLLCVFVLLGAAII